MSNPYRDESLPSNSESRGTKHTATVSPADARKSQTLVSNAEMATQAGSPNSGERFATLHAHTHNRLRHIIPARRYWRPIRQFSQTNFDLEKQLPKNVVQLLRDRISQALFGKQCEDDKTLLSSTAYLDHIQEQIHEVGEGRLEQLLRVLHASLPAADEAYLRIVADLAEILREDQRQDKTIHNLLTKLLQRYGVEEKTLVDDDRIAGWQAIFLVLCWLTMAIQPGAHAEAESFSIPLPSCCISIQKPQRVDAARRSIIGLFRGFGQLLPEFDGPTAKQSSTLLYVSSLNFKALRLFGRVRIDWTNALSAHLQFHPSTRTLHVFRFPSVCAMILMAGPRGSIFHSVFSEHFQDSDPSTSLLEQYLQEVLLSYRVLFGQGRASRELFTKYEEPRSAHKNIIDPLLHKLCGQKIGKSLLSLGPLMWPETCLDWGKEVQEQEVYETRLDFRFFGDRLLKLQAFNLRQQPNRIRDLWRDRRNALQWYTFWAVIVVGGLSVVLAIVQCLLSAAQLYFSTRSR